MTLLNTPLTRFLLAGMLLGALSALNGPLSASAQGSTVTIVGFVTDSETGEPLTNVNVFIAGSMQGTATDENGHFRLANVRTGAQRLYASMVGYVAEARNLNLREAGVHNVDFALEPAVIELEDVIVEGERDEQWLERLERFTRLFIGETPNADETEILNPEVLTFSQSLRHFRAFAEEPLVIENRALGYRLTYFLKEFEATSNRTRWDGEPLFEELEGTPQEEAAWQERRRDAFFGSFHHLMLALLEDRTEGQNFRLYARPTARTTAVADGAFGPSPMMSGQRYPLNSLDEILHRGETENERVLDFRGVVEVIYMGATESEEYREWRNRQSPGGMVRRGERFQTSQIWLERGPATIDYKGDIVDPYSVTRSGYYAYKRIADQLPKEYRPL